MSKKDRNFEGQVFAVPLGDGWFGFARALTFPLVEFYDYRSRDLPNSSDLVGHPVVFRIWVMKHALSGRRWKRLGVVPPRQDIDDRPWFFKQDRINGMFFRLRTGLEEIPATLEEVEGLECAAVWDPVHVEDRLRDHFQGQPNKWVESMRPKNRVAS